MNNRDMALSKVKPLCERLSRDYGVDLNLAMDQDHLVRVMKHYLAKRQFIMTEQGEAAALKDATYAKAVLISETVKLYLREIAPKRTRKRK